MQVALYTRRDTLDHRRRGGKLVSILQGGYDPRGPAKSTTAHVRALQGE